MGSEEAVSNSMRRRLISLNKREGKGKKKRDTTAASIRGTSDGEHDARARKNSGNEKH